RGAAENDGPLSIVWRLVRLPHKRRDPTMQYMLMCCFDEELWAKLPDTQKGQIMQEYDELMRASPRGRSGMRAAIATAAPSSAARRSRHEPAAGHDDGLAGDVGGIGRGKERDHPGDVLRGAHPAKGDVLAALPEELAGREPALDAKLVVDALVERRVDEPWRDRVDGQDRKSTSLNSSQQIISY